MARLVLLNGPPGVGKSTLARRYADAHPPTPDGAYVALLRHLS